MSASCRLNGNATVAVLAYRGNVYPTEVPCDDLMQNWPLEPRRGLW
jgi:hypothetical protein